jgi:hypothetical protein
MLLQTLISILTLSTLSLQFQTPTESIRNTLSLWSFYLDTGEYTSLSKVFTPNATLILPPPFGTSQGLLVIEAVLIKAAGNDTTVHALTWQEIDVFEGDGRARARTG